jgi:hypothetical protein
VFLEERITKTLEELVLVERRRLAVETQILTLLRVVAGVLPVGFAIHETVVRTEKEKTMPVDLQILDDGKGVLFTLQPVNAAKMPVPLPAGDTVTATSSAPATLAVAPDPGDPNANPPRPADTTGLVFLGTVPQPPVDATAIVVTFSASFGSSAANPIDVTADGSPAGFTITETAL